MIRQMGLNDVAARYEKETDRRIWQLAENIAANARKRVYRNLKPFKSYSPLAESIKVESDFAGGYRVITDQSYARFVEFGTQHMPPRPFLTPSVEEAKAGLSDYREQLSGKKI